MAIPPAVLKEYHLEDELRTAIRLIEIGLGEMQGLNSSNRAHHLTMQILSSGFERLMKCHICYGHFEKTGSFPNSDYLKTPGHDLLKLKSLILSDYFQENSPALSEDKKYLETDSKLNTVLDILSEFGKFGRYHNLDVVTDSKKMSRDVINEWLEYRDGVVFNEPSLKGKFTAEGEHEIWGFLAQDTTIVLEKFVRAICRQFTLGRLGKLAQQHSPTIVNFVVFNDSKLGITNYRIKSTVNQPKINRTRKRTLLDKLNRKFNSNYFSKRIHKAEFNGDWPFYTDEVVIENRHRHWCVVTVQGSDYALNGAAQGKYKLENVHNGGVAIQGKGIGPFIEMALELPKTKKE